MLVEKAYIGVDPGREGFISIVRGDTWQHYEMPKIGKLVDVNELNKIFFEISQYRDILVGIEDVHAIYGSSAGSTFSFGYICGIIEGIVVANNIPLIKIQPKKWQKEMWEGVPLHKKTSSTGKAQVTDTKATSLVAVKRLYPMMDLRRNERCRMPDNNKVDSILIATYLKRNY